MIYQEETGESEITELMTSFDEHVYSAKVILTSKRIISRPLNLLYKIECSNGNHDVTSEKTHQIQALDDDLKTVRRIPIQEGCIE